MDRNIVYPGSIPLDTDLLSINRNAMLGIGFLAQAVLGTNAVADGLVCAPTAPPSMSITVGPGSLTQFGPVDLVAYGSLPADQTDLVVKMGINTAATPFVMVPPAATGQSINYLIQASFQEVDLNPIVLPYYNAANPAQTFSGPANSGSAQNTARVQRVQLQLKAGPASNTGSQVTPQPDSGWIALYQVSVANGQTAVTAANIALIPTAPFVYCKLPALRPGVATGVQTFTGNGTFTVPPGVTQVEVEVWGAGSGTFASIPGLPSGGGSGGGYARKRITGVVPGQVIPVVVGSGGSGGTTMGGMPGAGQASSFGQFVSATGGSLNYLAAVSSPGNGATPPGIGVGGDVNFVGSAGQAGVLNQGGLGGGAPMGGMQNSGAAGNTGTFPGGGAGGAGTGPNGNTGFNGGAGGAGLVVVRW